MILQGSFLKSSHFHRDEVPMRGGRRITKVTKQENLLSS
jgi:hypothetical protein